MDQGSCCQTNASYTTTPPFQSTDDCDRLESVKSPPAEARIVALHPPLKNVVVRQVESSTPNDSDSSEESNPAIADLFELIRNSPFTRGLPPSKILQQSATAGVFENAIACDGIFESSFKNKELKEALQNIWHNGWL